VDHSIRKAFLSLLVVAVVVVVTVVVVIVVAEVETMPVVVN
jgi:hypothetical protein